MSDFAIKELYSVTLKPTLDMEINGRHYSENEPLIDFDKIQIAFLNENKRRVSARGGVGNQTLVTWEDTSSISIEFTEGIMSEVGLSLLSNSHLLAKRNTTTILPKKEVNLYSKLKEGQIVLESKYEIEGNLFIYRNGLKVHEYTLDEDKKTIHIEGGAEEESAIYTLFYDFIYDKAFDEFSVGHRAIKGFLSLSGRGRIKDDQTGKEMTVLFEIPKFKLLSDFSMRLGKKVSPYVYTFRGEGYPVGERGQQYVCKITYLGEDIDADF